RPRDGPLQSRSRTTRSGRANGARDRARQGTDGAHARRGQAGLLAHSGGTHVTSSETTTTCTEPGARRIASTLDAWPGEPELGPSSVELEPERGAVRTAARRGPPGAGERRRRDRGQGSAGAQPGDRRRARGA